MRRLTAALLAALVPPGALLPAPVAAALPPGFPDLSKFSAVEPAPYISVGIKGGRGIGFVTDGLSCGWQLSNDPNAHEGAVCSGNIPGMPAEVPHEQYAPGCDGISMSGPSGGVSPLYTFLRGNGPCVPPLGSHRLAVGAKITAGNTTCAVTADGVACVDLIVNHGFVLQQPLSWVF